MYLLMFFFTIKDGASETIEKPKGRRGSAGRPKVSQIMKAVQEGEALLKVYIY